jgi:hypothetical protein
MYGLQRELNPVRFRLIFQAIGKSARLAAQKNHYTAPDSMLLESQAHEPMLRAIGRVQIARGD